ncbi:hypothetical protein KUTeg_019541 [Tegillarca granosa]|uniref:Integrase core domain-containing protein n=1 Tax=Tegillarca granosa TaxID=220873 RepID=A0ABQ9EHY0_TEGGR|nr:hypothetical protein KUTeg_019541 [Tegillarca granosa]
MYNKCLQAGFIIPRNTVYHLMKILDPDGILSRKRKRLHRRQYVSNGPDYVWHVDSYDKLKPYGIAINGCIDGYSRNIIWLEANTTNSDPKVISNYYIKAVQRRKGCPQRVRADMGTENTYIEQFQRFLRRNHNDAFAGDKSFLYGKSTHNQRIEWLWGILRKEVGQFWMDLFAELSFNLGENAFSGDFLDKSLIQFCFMGIVQKDLDNFVEIWNTHAMSGGLNIRGGNRPIMLYTLPELYDKQQCLCNVDEREIEICAEETTPKQYYPCDETVRDLCLLLMEENEFEFPKDAENAKKLYIRLRELILSLL